MSRQFAANFAAAAAVSSALVVASSCATWKPAEISPAQSAPRTYSAPFVQKPPALGGTLEQGEWARAPWSEDFTDIEGPAKPAPTYRTRAKMLWDTQFLYVGAELCEPDIWSSLSGHDQVIFHDNDFEVFIDPNGDGHEYYEIEINAQGTVFDLFLHRSYRNGGPAIHEWNVMGQFAKSTSFNGTPDDPRDIDHSWTVMMAIPWQAFVPPVDGRIDALDPNQRAFGEGQRKSAAPKPGDQWRINFSRVQWRHNHESLDASGARLATPTSKERGANPVPYAKRPGLAEDNWVWSPQWAVDMHLPQFWGKVTFVR